MKLWKCKVNLDNPNKIITVYVMCPSTPLPYGDVEAMSGYYVDGFGVSHTVYRYVRDGTGRDDPSGPFIVDGEPIGEPIVEVALTASVQGEFRAIEVDL